MRKLLLLLLPLFAACPPPNVCSVDADCFAGERCSEGTCVAATATDAGADGGTDAGVDAGVCANGATRPCTGTAVGACEPGAQTCVGGAWAAACVGEVKPVTEICNGVDDNCDGTVDEGVELQLYPDGDGDGHGDAASAGVIRCGAMSGYVASHDDCNDGNASIAPGAAESCSNTLDDNCNGTVNEDCGCTTPGATEPCCGGRGTQTCTNGTLTACSASVTTETCNGLDDDCDGMTDEGASLCGGGQSCVAAACACPGGQALCGGTCTTVSAEVCDGVDNDCNGTVDDGVTINCYRDTDGDTWVDGTLSQQCPVSGTCPAGYLEPAFSQGVDCAPNDATKYHTLATLADGDNDGHCNGAPLTECVGTAAPAGRRISAACESMSDCNDGNAQVWDPVQLRDDADGDGYCVGGPVPVCASPTALPAGKKLASQCAATDDCDDGNAQAFGFQTVRVDSDGDGFCVNPSVNACGSPTWLPAGTRRPGACQATDDCNDANAAAMINTAWAPDSDNDGYCTAPPPSSCVGLTPPQGYRRPADCLGFSDCATGDATRYRTVMLRADGDNDAWCSGAAVSTCIGAVPAGKRIDTDCGGEDCSDTNSYVHTDCLIIGGYSTSQHTQTCPSANTPTTYSVTVLNTCGPGYNTVNARAVRTAGTGSCAYVSNSQVAQQCNFLDGSTCGVVADCQAY